MVIFIIRSLLLKYRLIFLRVLKVFDEPLGESNTERQVKNISRYFKRRHIIYLLSNSKKFTPGVKLLEFKSNRRHQDFPKSKIYTNHSNQNIFGGGNFLGDTNSEGGKIFRPTKMLVFAMVIVFLTFLGLGINSPSGVKTPLVG